MMLPTPPNEETLRAHSPNIAPVPEGISRPFWSVMIPTYNCGDYLQRTLKSVLSQDPGSDLMQIEVVDACSTKDDPQAMVHELGKNRVSYYRLPVNKGGPNTFNTCIERARGHWIHLLHGDDMILPRFYDTYLSMIRAHPQVRMVVGQNITIDEHDRWLRLAGPLPPVGGGILEDFLEQQATQVLVNCPSVVVRRDAFEQVGGFCTLLDSCSDWDMEFRIGQLAPVACVGHPLALYRCHGVSETRRLMVTATNIQEAYFVVKSNLARLNGSRQASEQNWRNRLAARAEADAWYLDSRNCTEGRYNQARWAWMLKPNGSRFVVLLKSWLKHRLKRAAHSTAPERSSE